jgi:hypothetical protein
MSTASSTVGDTGVGRHGPNAGSGPRHRRRAASTSSRATPGLHGTLHGDQGERRQSPAPPDPRADYGATSRPSGRPSSASAAAPSSATGGSAAVRKASGRR